MANGFCRNGAARREIDAERGAVRHSRNSFGVSRQSRPIVPRLFRNTKQCLRHLPGRDLVRWHRTSCYDAALIVPPGTGCALSLFNVR
jgi:hypothetical protein